MLEQGTAGSLVTLFCDSGDRYAETYYSDDWLAEHGLVIAPYVDQIDRFLDTGEWRHV
jgi:cysteine synthase A